MTEHDARELFVRAQDLRLEEFELEIKQKLSEQVEKSLTKMDQEVDEIRDRAEKRLNQLMVFVLAILAGGAFVSGWIAVNNARKEVQAAALEFQKEMTAVNRDVAGAQKQIGDATQSINEARGKMQLAQNELDLQIEKFRNETKKADAEIAKHKASIAELEKTVKSLVDALDKLRSMD